MERFLAAVVQMASGSDRAANVARASALVREAAGRGARMVVLPEVFAWRGTVADDPAGAEGIPGPTSTAMATLARELGLVLCMGSILEAVAGEGRRYNTSCLIDASGAVIATYRKIHLFDVALPGRVAVQESATRLPGDAAVTARTPLATIGCSICYDLRFPELYRKLGERGVRIVTVPAAFTLTTGKDHWHVLLRARAIENQVFVLAPAQHGRHPRNRQTYGKSLVVDPWGDVLAQCAEGEGFAIARLDFAAQDRVRASLPCLSHRRL